MKKFKKGDPVLWHGNQKVYEVYAIDVVKLEPGLQLDLGGSVGLLTNNGDVFYEFPEMLTPFPDPYVPDAHGRPIRVGQLVESVDNIGVIKRVEEISASGRGFNHGPLIRFEGHDRGWSPAEEYRVLWETYRAPPEPKTEDHEFKVKLTVPRGDRWDRETWQEQLRLLVDQTWGTDMGEGTVMTVTVESVDE